MRQLPDSTGPAALRLRQIKLLHTAIWAAMVAAILLIPVAGWLGHSGWALGLTVLIVGEGVVLACNGWRCPLTDVAARYTDERADNFDIYLPVMLARYNKLIFGTLFIAGELIWLWRWMRRPGI